MGTSKIQCIWIVQYFNNIRHLAWLGDAYSPIHNIATQSPPLEITKARI